MMNYSQIGTIIGNTIPTVDDSATTIIVKAPDVYLDGDKISRDTTERQYEDSAVRRI
ncbi:MAG: hypothetical protein RSA97_02255 [Oscillospiraceae bacterium]